MRARNKNQTAQLLLADKSFLLRLVGDQRSVGAAPMSQQKYLERGVRIKEIKEDRTASGGLFVDAKQCQVYFINNLHKTDKRENAEQRTA